MESEANTADSKLLSIHHQPKISIIDPSLTVLVTKKGHDSIIVDTIECCDTRCAVQ
jgi:hypothetical protein